MSLKEKSKILLYFNHWAAHKKFKRWLKSAYELMKFFKISFYPKIFLLWKGILLSSTHTPSVQHIGSTQGPHPFSTRNSSVPHQNPLSSTPKTPQNWRVCWTEGCVELKGFWCGTEGCVELRGCETERVKSRRKLDPNTYVFDISNYYNVCKIVYSDIWKKS